MKYILIASLVLGGCVTTKPLAICEPDYSDHVCPERGHGPCPLCPTTLKITPEELYAAEEVEQRNADALGLRLVDYLHLVNTNQIKR
jgi:hypothetical protein